MGWSRSTAVALSILMQSLWPEPGAFERAADTLLEIRPKSRPNVLIAELGFSCFMPADQAKAFAQRVATYEAFASNRAATSALSIRTRKGDDAG